MNVLKHLSKTTKIFGGLIAVVVVLFTLLIALNTPSKNSDGSLVVAAPLSFDSSSASADNKVEALRAMTANLSAVRTENAALKVKLEQLTQSQQQQMTALKAAFEKQQFETKKAMQDQQQAWQRNFQSAPPIANADHTGEANKMSDNFYQSDADSRVYAIGEVDDSSSKAHFSEKEPSADWQWIEDLSSGFENGTFGLESTKVFPAGQDGDSQADSNDGGFYLQSNSAKEFRNSQNVNALGANTPFNQVSRVNPADNQTNHQSDPYQAIASDKTLATPVYTLPINATLTGARLMTPLIARIPIDGDLPDPYPFKAVLSANNLTANGYPLTGIKGAVVGGFSRGDLLQRCARGDITSITFVFEDGTIASAKANDERSSFGYLSSPDGNPCIAGEYHGNEDKVLMGGMALSFTQAYAKSLSNAEYQTNTTAEGNAIRQLVGDGTKAAVGEGLNGAASNLQDWWNRRIKNAFDFIWVSNWNAQTQQARQVVINITEPIAIDHQVDARKVDYTSAIVEHPQQLD